MPYHLATPQHKKVGWDIRVELMTSSATNWRPNQLGQSHHNLARCGGLEPPAYCLEGSCSIQLSYWRKQSKALAINTPLILWSG